MTTIHNFLFAYYLGVPQGHWSVYVLLWNMSFGVILQHRLSD